MLQLRHEVGPYAAMLDMVLEQLENEVKELTARAEEADRQEQSQCETKRPDEIARRKQRMVRIREAVDVIEDREKAKAEESKRREAKAEERRQRRERGEKVGGREPKPSSPWNGKHTVEASLRFSERKSRHHLKGWPHLPAKK